VRFLIVGGGTSLGYVLTVAFLVEVIGVGDVLSAAMAYLAMLPVSFVAHKVFTYESQNKALPESIRFAVMHGLTACICGTIMWFATGFLDATHWVGSAITVVTAPAINFVMLEFWVFKKRNAGDVRN
jgi:putative flippase GtrA